MTISPSVRKFVHERAENCCEYCRLASKSVKISFHIDHIIPVKHDGSDDAKNLCLSCYNCNAHKSHDLTGFDPVTGDITRLYDPRKQIWSDHFEIQETMQIKGLTSIGRTTIRVLQINLDERIESRQVLAEIGEYPC